MTASQEKKRKLGANHSGRSVHSAKPEGHPRQTDKRAWIVRTLSDESLLSNPSFMGCKTTWGSYPAKISGGKN